MTAVASVAKTAESKFAKYYDAFIPGIKAIVVATAPKAGTDPQVCCFTLIRCIGIALPSWFAHTEKYCFNIRCLAFPSRVLVFPQMSCIHLPNVLLYPVCLVLLYPKVVCLASSLRVLFYREYA